jgi:serine/threonine protein kinase
MKPENVLLSFDDKDLTSVKFTKIIDFGFAIYLGKNYKANPDDSTEEEIFGTPNYVAPEVL